jgi:integrase
MQVIGDVARASPRTREIMSKHVRRYLENIRNLIDDEGDPKFAVATMRYTGLRRGDAVRMGVQHVRDGVITIRTEKHRKARLAS